MGNLNFMDWLAGALLIIGGINWGLVGFFQYDLLAQLFGDGSGVYRVITALVGLGAVYIIGELSAKKLSFEGRHAHT